MTDGDRPGASADDLALREREERLRVTLEAGGLGTWDFDPQSGALRWDARCRALFGFTPEREITYDVFLAGLHPDDRETTDIAVRRALEPGGPGEYDVQYRTVGLDDGVERWVAARGRTIFDAEGVPLSFVGTVRDVTAERDAAAALAASERRYRDLVDGLDAIVWEANPDPFRFTFVSRRAEEMLGYPVADWYADPDFLAKIVHPDDRDLAPSRGSAIGRSRSDAEYRVLHRNGREIWLRDIAYVARDERGRPVSLRGVMVDVTDRRINEEQVRLLSETLERRVVERTRDLEAANRELEAFAYSVSHDLRAPLRHIAGFAGLLDRSDGAGLGESGRRSLTVIEETARQAGKMVDELLEFSRAARDDVRRMPVDTRRLVDEVVREFEPDLTERDVVWRIGDIPPAEGDPAMLRLVWRNLVSNALKFTRGRTPAEIEISGESREGETVYRVKDNGAGFDPAHADRIFDVFQRLHRAREFEGTGIGLANVRRIVERHGGRVWADATPGEGAEFRFSLPESTRST